MISEVENTSQFLRKSFKFTLLRTSSGINPIEVFSTSRYYGKQKVSHCKVVQYKVMEIIIIVDKVMWKSTYVFCMHMCMHTYIFLYKCLCVCVYILMVCV